MSPRLGLGHAGHGAQVGERLVGAAGDVGIAEVGDQVAGFADRNQTPQGLDAAALVVVPPFVDVEPLPGGAVLRGPAGLAAVAGPAQDWTTEPFPVLLGDAAADVGEPARAGDEVDEQPGAERAVLAGQHVGDVGAGGPPVESR